MSINKRCLMIALFFFFMAGASVSSAQQQSYQVYEPSGKRDGSIILPKYDVKPRGDGSYGVYPSGKPVLPQYIVKPAPLGPGQQGYKVYPSGKPVIPIGKVK